MRISRADRSIFGQWWLSFDRVLVVALLLLVLAGIILSLAASPSVAIKKGLPALYFAERHIFFALVSVVLMLVVSMLTPRAIRRLSLGLFAASVVAMVAVLLTGDEINGARRWLRIAGFSLQPSETAKPAFAVLVAWAFAESERRPDMPGLWVALGLYLVMAPLLVMQPDIGQTLLISAVWVVLFLSTGRSHLWAVGIGAIAAIGSAAAYASFPHVRFRIDRFLFPVRGDNSQIDRAYQAFAEGGLLGRGPGEGTIKTVLPDAHTDFVFAVVAEEYGALACLVLIMLLSTVVLRPLLRAVGEGDGFIRHATVALSLLLGLQALINLGTNVGLLPAKGMTLPLVSAGGSSTLAVSITCGMLIGLSRRRSPVHRMSTSGPVADATGLRASTSGA